MTSKIENTECLCLFVDLLGDAKSQVSALISGLQGLLQTLKVLIQLTNINVENEIRKLAYQAALAILEGTIQPVEAPFSIILSYTNSVPDCAPVATITQALKGARDRVLKPFDELEYEINQMILALEEESKEVEWIDRIIEVLDEIQAAIDEC